LIHQYFKLACVFIIVGIQASVVTVAYAQTNTRESSQGFVWKKSSDDNSRYQLEVKQLVLADVLKGIAAETNIPIHYSVLPEGIMTATCVGVDIKQVMQCLLNGKADLIFRYPKSTEKKVTANNPIEMWVLGSRIDSPSSCANSGLSNSEKREEDAAPKLDQTADREQQEQLGHVLELAKSKDAMERAEAIGALISVGKKDDPEIKQLLEEALNDADAIVRSQAISTYSHRNGDAAIPAIQQALHDKDSGVRLMAVDVAGNNRLLLQQAANDEEESIRNLAITKLEALSNSNK
jgi:hypothetical protein